MGHRKQRKRARKQSDRQGNAELFFSGAALEHWIEPEPDEPSAPWQWQDAFADLPRPAVKTCGQCREFVAELDNGRGECLHPGSGVLSPWSDTEACPFFEPVQRIRRGR